MKKKKCIVCKIEFDCAMREITFFNGYKCSVCEDCYRELEEHNKRNLEDIRESADTE